MLANGFDLFWGNRVTQKFGVPRAIAPREIYKQADNREDGSVESGSDVLVNALVKCLRQNGGRKRQKRNEQKKQGVEQQQLAVRLDDPFKHNVVVDPDRAYYDKANRIRQVGRPEE